eukprot:TRINITY_DN8738_c0_g1_i1.p2 TRINITY_DN8738_c0_g1~~TRINITY_DN8738_c0_g1_i1.p2  ORF type:complete len:175 (+),score=62.31 TRINITY_DN8738_c0_g1_i1:14-538(+)
MPKNKGKGGKKRKRGKGDSMQKRELITRDGPEQEYASVTRMLGNGRVEAQCFDGKVRLCHIRGKMRKRVWINAGDIILLGLRDFQDDKADVIVKYKNDEVVQLKKMGHLPASAVVNEDNDENSDDDPFVFRAREGDEFSDEEDDVGEQPDRYGKLPDYDDMSDMSDDEINLDTL